MFATQLYFMFGFHVCVITCAHLYFICMCVLASFPSQVIRGAAWIAHTYIVMWHREPPHFSHIMWGSTRLSHYVLERKWRLHCNVLERKWMLSTLKMRPLMLRYWTQCVWPMSISKLLLALVTHHSISRYHWPLHSLWGCGGLVLQPLLEYLHCFSC